MTCPWSILVRTAPFLVGLLPVATAFRQRSPLAAKALGLVATGGMGIATYYQVKTFFGSAEPVKKSLPGVEPLESAPTTEVANAPAAGSVPQANPAIVQHMDATPPPIDGQMRSPQS